MELLDSQTKVIAARDVVLIALAATVLRGLIALVSPHLTHEPPFAHAPLWMYAYWGDGPSYLAQARAMCGDASHLTEFDRRVFPGFPALIAVLHTITRASFEYIALTTPWICSGIAAGACAVFFNDKRLGWAVALLIPHYLSYSSMPMTEAPLLAFTLVGLIVGVREGVIAAIGAGLLLGCAVMIRPMAVFAGFGLFIFELYRARKIKAFAFALSMAIVVGVSILLMKWWAGDALRGVHVYAHDKAAYDGELFTWPFHSLLATPHRPDLPFLKKGKIAYIWIHVVLVLVGCGLLLRNVRRKTIDKLDVLCLPWLIANTLFILCVGSKWGFLAFPRFTVPAMPAAFWAYRSVLPRKGWIWALIGLISLIIALDSVRRMN